MPMAFWIPRYGVAFVLAASFASAIACSPTEEIVVDDNPNRPEDTDDTAPKRAEFDDQLSFEGRYGTENHSTDLFRFDVAALRDDAEKADAAQLYASHAAHVAAH